MLEKQLVNVVEPVVKAVVAVEKKVEQIEQKIAAMPVPENGRDGKDAEPVDVKAIVDEVVKLIPVPKDGKDAEPVDVPSIVDAVAKLIPVPLDGKDAEPVDIDALAEVVTEKALAKIPVPKDGAPGRDGKDAEPVDTDALVEAVTEKALAKIPVPKDGKDGADGKSVEAPEVAEVLKADPTFLRIVTGRDGIGIKSITQDGNKLEIELDSEEMIFVELPAGEKGDTGARGADGIDGIGVNIKLWQPRIYREGEYAQANIGQIYKAVRDTNGVPGKSEDWERIGSGGMRWTGLKKADFEYQEGDLFIENGSCFIWSGGKGSMFVQRGRDGKDGVNGKDGRDGRDAPKPIHIEVIGTKMVMALDDGAVLEADFVELESIRKQLTYLDQQFQALSEPIDTPIKRYAGVWKVGKDYAEGDTVTFNSALYLCIKSDANSIGMTPENWVKLAGRGGGSSKAMGWPPTVTSNLNMSGFSIVNVGTGNTPGSLTTKGYVDARVPKIVVQTDSAALLAQTGAGVQDKLTSALGELPIAGAMVFVGFSAATGADNTNAGVWRYDGVSWAKTALGSASTGGGATVKTGTAAALATHGTTPIAALAAGFNAMFSSAPTAGEIVLISGGAGPQSIFNGTYLYDGTVWHLISTDLSGYINGGVKQLTTDPDPAITTWPTGSILSTLGRGNREIRIKDGAGNVVVVYSESEIAALIAASRTFKGTAVEAGTTRVGSIATSAMAAQSALTAADLGSYWVYVGTAGHTVAVNDMGGAASAIDGLVLQSGDWIMVANVGTTAAPRYEYVLIHGDSLGRGQADNLYGHQVWTAGAWETGSIVRYQATPTAPLRYYKASSAIVPADPAPGVTGPALPAGAGTAITFGMPDGLVDGTIIHFVFTPVGGGAPITFDYTVVAANHPASQLAVGVNDAMNLNPAVQAFGAATLAAGNSVTLTSTRAFTATADQGVTVTVTTPAVAPSNKWVDITPTASLALMPEVDVTTTAPVNGDSLVFDGTANQWKPQQVGQPMVYFGQAAFNTANVDAAHNWGMDAATRPDPAVWIPAIGDLYICTATGVITQLTGAGGTTNPSTRRSGGVTGGSVSAMDIVLESLDDIGDVDLATAPPSNGQGLVYNATSRMWVPGDIPVAYSKTEVDAKLNTLITGISHDVAVIDFTATPPAVPVTDEVFIVKATATGAWATHENELARWNGVAWVFVAPQANEAHLNEADNFIYHWNGTAWNKIAVGQAAPTAVSSLFTIGDLKQSILTETQFIAELGVVEGRKWVLADGRNVAGTRYATVTGHSNVPDLRGAFLRMAGQNATNAAWTGGALNAYQEDTTRAPRSTGFTADSNGGHRHSSGIPSWSTDDFAHYGINDTGVSKKISNVDGWSSQTPYTDYAAAHTHSISGGDTETRPKNYGVNFFIKVD